MTVLGKRMLVGLICLATTPLGACDSKQESSRLRGQTNATVTFYGKVVDQEGRPLSGTRFEFRVEAYPSDWTYETRGRDNDVSAVSAVSDEGGLFEFTVTGCKLVRLKADRAGSRHFFEEDLSDHSVQTLAYRLIAWGQPWHRTARDNPAVFVFVDDGAREVSALLCRGGYDSGGTTRWTLNSPAWPTQPSLKDVVRKPSATQP